LLAAGLSDTKRAVRWAGVQVLGALLVLAIIGVTVSALFGEHGVAHLVRLRAERAEIGRSAFGLMQENTRLRAEITRLRGDDLHLEALARRLRGFVRPDEIVYRFRRDAE